MRRFAAFVLVPALGIVVPLLGIPAITTQFGSVGWADVAVGQSLGMAAAVVIELGWALNGPQRVARSTLTDRARLYWTALLGKAFVAIFLCAVAVVLALILAITFPAASAMSAAAAALAGLSPAWYFTGTGEPRKILRTDVLPRAIAVLAGSVALVLGLPLIVYPLLLLVAGLLSPVIGARSVGASGVFDRHLLSLVREELGSQVTAVSGRAASGIYIALPVTLVAIAAPQSVATFAAVERLARMTLQICQAIPTWQQRWMGNNTDPEAGGAALGTQRFAIWSGAMTGLTAGALFTVVSGPLANLLFSGMVDVPVEAGLMAGLMIAISCTSRSTGGLCLVSMNLISSILRSALLGAAIGVIAIPVLANVYGVIGAILGEVLAEAAVLALQATTLRRAWRQRPNLKSRYVAQFMVRDPSYPRNRMIREELQRSRIAVTPLPAGPPSSLVRESLHLLRTFVNHATGARVVILSEFNLQHALATRVLASITGAYLVIDWFVGLHETQVEDRGNVSPRSLRARYYMLVDGLAIRLASLVLTDTVVRRNMLYGRSNGKAVVMALPVGAPRWAAEIAQRAQPNAPGSALVRIMYYGNFIPLHGLEKFLPALAGVRDVALRARLTLVGDGQTRRETELLVAQLDLSSLTTFRDAVSELELAELIYDHDIIVGIFGHSVKANSVVANKVWQGLVAGKIVVTAGTPATEQIAHLAYKQLVCANDSSIAAIEDAIERAIRQSHEGVSAQQLLANRQLLDEHVRDGFASFALQIRSTIEGKAS